MSASLSPNNSLSPGWRTATESLAPCWIEWMNAGRVGGARSATTSAVTAAPCSAIARDRRAIAATGTTVSSTSTAKIA